MSTDLYRDYWRKQSKIDIKVFTFEGIPFDMMALNGDQFKQVQDCSTSTEMLELASNLGQMYNRKRISDDADLSQDFEGLWSYISGKIDYNDTPTLREQAGMFVCEISTQHGDLVAVVKDKQAEEAELKAMEEAENNIVDGDNITQEQLDSDAASFIADANAHVA
jgi:hypothetical protein